MRFGKPIIFAGIWFFLLGLTTPAAIKTNAAGSHTNAESGEQPFHQARLLVAQDDPEGQAAGETGLNTENRSRPEAAKKTNQEAPPSKAKTDPSPSYEPSEKIKADQAVDFPYDI